MDETIDIPKPSFTLTRGAEFEAVCDTIESKFKASLKKVENDQDTVFDVNSSSWYESILQWVCALYWTTHAIKLRFSLRRTDLHCLFVCGVGQIPAWNEGTGGHGGESSRRSVCHHQQCDRRHWRATEHVSVF